MNRSTPGLPVHHQLPAFTQTHIHRVSDVIQPSHPLLSPSPPALNLSQHQGLFQWVNSSHEVAKALEFQPQHHSFKEHPGLIFRMDWLDLLAVQGTLKSLVQHHSSKVWILWCSAFFIVLLSHPLSKWSHPAISSSVVPFSSCPQSIPASKYFLMSQLFAWGGQSIGVRSEEHTSELQSQR